MNIVMFRFLFLCCAAMILTRCQDSAVEPNDQMQAGCMDSVADNYNPFAVEDDSSCVYAGPFEINLRLGRGMNLGNALEAPEEGDWGITLQADYFTAIADAGFQSVRVPIRWSSHALETTPYTIDELFFLRIDWVIEQALSNGLLVIINMHHYTELMASPPSHLGRLLSMWEQIAERYASTPNLVIFELLNEPHDNLTSYLYNSYLIQLIDQVRSSNPHRILMVNTANWGGLGGLSDLQIPDEEQNIIVTCHYYEPFEFTHQGASWVDGSDAWLGNAWTATYEQRSAMEDDLNQAVTWSVTNNRPLNIGEFGAYSAAHMDHRALWTNYFVLQAGSRGFSWTYWEFGSGFGAYDLNTGEWYEPLLNALIQ